MDNHTIIYKDISELIPYVNNSRTHSDEQVTQIAASIKEFGFINPVLLDDNNGVIAGGGRLLASKKIGKKLIPCVELSHLSEAQKKAYIIADNKLALNAGWDDELLSLEIGELSELDFDLDLLGFTDDELGLNIDYSDKNNELSLDDFDDNMDMVFSFTKEQYENVSSKLFSINESKEIAIMTVLNGRS